MTFKIIKIAKNIITLFFVFFAFLNNTEAQSVKTCGTDYILQQTLKQYPEKAKVIDQLEKEAQAYAKKNKPPYNTVQNEPLRIIPIVFHIIHDNGPENVSTAQVLDALRIINQDFSKTNADTILLSSNFGPIASKTGFEFRLARIDPNGNCTQGITRTESKLTYAAHDNVKNLISWDTDKYLNIWVVNTIAFGAGGYAYYPGTPPNAAYEGIVVLSRQLGSIGHSFGGGLASRTLTHEIGHYFNLPHPWGSTNAPGNPTNCQIDDGVADTPNTIGVAGQGCDTNQISCGSVDNVENYMDYSNCGRMFTNGQKDRMRVAAASQIGGRSNLWKLSNLIATGTLLPSTPPPCRPTADFEISANTICQGDNFTLNARPINTFGETTLTYKWFGTNIDFQYDSAKTTTAVISQPGFYNIGLIVNNQLGADTIYKNSLIQVNPSTATINQAFLETFNTDLATQTVTGWRTEGDGQKWAHDITVAGSNGGCYRLDNRNMGLNQESFLVSPPINMKNVSGPYIFSLNFAYAANESTNTDLLSVDVSRNCGQTWTTRLTRSGSSLQTAPLAQWTNFKPKNQTEWNELLLNLITYRNDTNLTIRIGVKNGNGNNVYIDNFMVGNAPLSLSEEVNLPNKILIFPNPAQNNITVTNNSHRNTINKIEIYTITGKKTKTYITEIPAKQQITLNTQQLSDGIYLVKAIEKQGNGFAWEKIIINRK